VLTDIRRNSLRMIENKLEGLSYEKIWGKKKKWWKIGEKHLESFRINSEDPEVAERKKTQWQRNTFLNK